MHPMPGAGFRVSWGREYKALPASFQHGLLGHGGGGALSDKVYVPKEAEGSPQAF